MQAILFVSIASGVLFAATSTSGSQPSGDEQLVSWWHEANLPLYVEYFRFHGVRSVTLVVCSEEDFSGRSQNGNPIGKVVRGILERQFYVNVFHDKDDDVEFNLEPLSYKIGIIVNLEGSCARRTLQTAEKRNLFTTNRFWLLLGGEVAVPNVFIPPDGEVRVMSSGRLKSLVDIYKVDTSKSYKIRKVGVNISSVCELVNSLQRFGSAISYRENLEGLVFKTGLVIAFPDMFTDIEDLSMRHIDTITKVNYPIIRSLSNKLNMSFNTHQTDNWGWMNSNGTFDGLMGRFQRFELDFAQNGVFMRLDRLAVAHFVMETFQIRAGIMFRQPSLSAVSNIFALPFTSDVWISILIFLLFSAAVMTAELAFSPLLFGTDFLDSLVFAWGAMCQQGYHLTISNRSARILVFTTFVTTLFLFTSFSANIVALLQSPSESIRSLSDLRQSPLEIGVQDTVYNKVFFTESTDPITKTLYQKKIQPKGDHVYMRPNKGMEKVRTGLFAYQVELQAGYQVISDTFTEPEKCGLKELEPFKLPILAIPVRTNFPYKELFRRQLRWQREVGLMNREELKWFPQKPKCESSVGGFVSIGIAECRYALAMFGYGLLVAVLALFVEILKMKITNWVKFNRKM